MKPDMGEEMFVQSSNGRYLKDIEVNKTVERKLKAIGINAKLEVYDWPTSGNSPAEPGGYLKNR
jgi:hypothetical protein